MNGDYSLWRIIISRDEVDAFHDALENIKGGDESNRLQCINPGDYYTHCYDVILNEEELLVLRLAIPGLIYRWIKDWINAKL